jgi:8-amino-7-oxononanoate synthase
VIAASLAKGFGVPIAFVAGVRKLIERYERSSETRTHCSPVAAPALHAAENAIAFNQHTGDRARAGLAQLVSRFCRKLASTALEPAGGLFPSLSIAGTQGLTAENVHACLRRMEIQTVLQRQRVSGEPRLGILITATHGSRDIDRLADALLGLLESLPAGAAKRHPGTASLAG